MFAALVIALTLSGAPRPSDGSELVFHGWSRDSRLVAYTRHRAGKDRSDQRVHRFVKDGVFEGFGRKVGADVAKYARDQGYVATPVPRRELERNRAQVTWELVSREVVLVLTIDVGAEVSWRLTRNGVELGRHTFDRIYLEFDPELYPSPDGSQAVLVMHLDTGWETDAAIFPVSLGN